MVWGCVVVVVPGGTLWRVVCGMRWWWWCVVVVCAGVVWFAVCGGMYMWYVVCGGGAVTGGAATETVVKKDKHCGMCSLWCVFSMLSVVVYVCGGVCGVCGVWWWRVWYVVCGMWYVVAQSCDEDSSQKRQTLWYVFSVACDLYGVCGGVCVVVMVCGEGDVGANA